MARELRRLHVEDGIGVVGHGRGRPAPGCAPGRAAARARRRPHPPGGARARALPHGRARHAALRPGAPLARGRRPPARGAGRAAAHLRRGGALPRRRARAPAHRARGDRLDRRTPSTSTRASPRTRPRRCAPRARRSRRRRCSRACRVQDAFRVLWEELPCSRRLVDAAAHEAEARRELDTVVTFANVVAEADDGADKSVQGFLESLDAGEHGPGHSAWERSRPDAVRVLTAHGTVGREFDAVARDRRERGQLPERAPRGAHVRPGGARPRDHATPSATASAWRTSGACSTRCSRAPASASCSSAPTPIPMPTS